MTDVRDGSFQGSARVLDRTADCRVDVRKALLYLGHSDQEIDEALGGRIDRVVESSDSASRPAWCYQVFPVDAREDDVRLVGSTIAFSSRGTAAMFSRARACAVMVATLGLANEQALQRLMASEPVDALIFDAASSSLVESCADSCERAVHAWAQAEGWHVGQRMSPGYGDLPLSLQGSIVSALGAGRALGVSVTADDLLIPLKSISALVGIFASEEDARAARRSCEECVAAAGCAYLRAGRPCWKQVG